MQQNTKEDVSPALLEVRRELAILFELGSAMQQDFQRQDEAWEGLKASRRRKKMGMPKDKTETREVNFAAEFSLTNAIDRIQRLKEIIEHAEKTRLKLSALEKERQQK